MLIQDSIAPIGSTPPACVIPGNSVDPGTPLGGSELSLDCPSYPPSVCVRSPPMTFSLPDLPYSHDALAPYMSRETLEYHHDKHHLAYVNNGNNLLKGTEWEGKSLEEVVKGSFGKNAGLFNNAGQHYNHLHFW